MHFTSSTLTALLWPFATAAMPLVRRQSPAPLSQEVITLAGGGVPSGTLPRCVSQKALKSFQAANWLENMESFFFQAGHRNLTGWGTGRYPANTLEVVGTVAAQEQTHVATFETVLNHYNASTVPPCKYQFPVTTTPEFLEVAQHISSVSIGAVIDLASSLAESDPGLVPSLTSALSVEARHDAFFRTTSLGLIPNPSPFDTRISTIWALNLANSFVVPGSCPFTPEFPTLPLLTIAPPPSNTTDTDTHITFTFDPSQLSNSATSKQFYIGWANKADKPTFSKVTMKTSGIAETTIPNGLSGVAFAVLTNRDCAKDVDELTAGTLAGPAIVQIS